MTAATTLGPRAARVAGPGLSRLPCGAAGPARDRTLRRSARVEGWLLPGAAKVVAQVERFDEEMRLRGYAPRTRKAYRARAPEATVRTGVTLLPRATHQRAEALLHDGAGRANRAPPASAAAQATGASDSLDPDEFRRFLAAGQNPKHVAILAVAYSAGLRVSEVVRLRPEDLDRDRGLINVRGGKGRKDRCTLLSHLALDLLTPQRSPGGGLRKSFTMTRGETSSCRG